MFRGEDEDAGEREKGEGVRGIRSASEWQQAGRRWRCACVCAAGTRPCPTVPRRKTTGRALVGWAGQVGGGKLGRLGWTGRSR